MIKEIGNRGTGYSTIIKLQLIELLILLSRYYSLIAKKRVSPGKNDRELTARRIYGYLERNYDQKITLTSLGELFNISVRQLNRVIKQEYDKSVIDLLHEIRIERAKHLLADTDMKVIVIATVVGYEDPAFFSRLFLRHVGCSPSKYRTGLELDL
jgi:transcriptional regulator GlxA family with amidase domain